MSSLGETRPDPWWACGTLKVGAAGIEIGGRSVVEWVDQLGTPLYLYDSAIISALVATLEAALMPFARSRIFYAMKANRFRPLLDMMRAGGRVGIDACSPGEVTLAREVGFAPEEISVTTTNFSLADLDSFAAAGVHINFDQVSVLSKYGQRVAPGIRIGLRIDPAISMGYGVNAHTDYNGSKLGLSPEDLPAALDAAQRAGLVVDTLHLHLGWGLREQDLPAFCRVLALLAKLATTVSTLECINVGGGLGGRLREADRPMPLADWAAAIVEAFGVDGPTIACEPGTLLVAPAGLLVAQVNTVWQKHNEHWVGLNCGLAVNILSSHYDLNFEIARVVQPVASTTQVYHVVGHINDAGDIFARSRPLPKIVEDDLVALLPAGAYGSSMASHHCLRGDFAEHLCT